MSIAILALIIALVLGLIEEFQSNGRSLLGWAVIAICVGGLWGNV